MKANPKFSEGARLERAAFRSRLRRSIKNPYTAADADVVIKTLTMELDWILERQKRYDKVAGGLGKK